MSWKVYILKAMCCILHQPPSFLPSSAGPHEGCYVSTVGFRVRLQLLAGADAEWTVSTRNCQRVQQHTPEPAAARRGHAGQLQTPGLLGMHRDCRWRRESVSVGVCLQSGIREERFLCKWEFIFFSTWRIIAVDFFNGLDIFYSGKTCRSCYNRTT